MGFKSSDHRPARRSTGLSVLALLLMLSIQGVAVHSQQNNPFDAAKEAATAAESTEAAAPPAEAAPGTATASPEASAPTEAEAPAPSSAPAEEKPATPPGKKSLDEYKDLLRRHSVKQEYQKVIEVCDEIGQVYPGDESIQYYRTRAEKSLELQEKKNKLKSIRDQAAGRDLPEPETASPADVAPVIPAETPKAEKTPSPAPPSPVAVAPLKTSSGPGLLDKLKPIIGGFLLAGGTILVFLGLTRLKKRKPASDLPPMTEPQQDEWQPEVAGFAQPTPAAPGPVPAWDQDPGAGQSVEDDLFTGAASSAAESGAASDIFNEPPSRAAAPRPRAEDTADQSDRFVFFADEAPAAQAQTQTATANRAPAAEEPVRFDFGSQAPISFETPKPKAEPQSAPWAGNAELDSFPMLKMDGPPAAAPPPAPATPPEAAAVGGATRSKAPWESKSDTGTAPGAGKATPVSLPPDDESLPALDVGTAPSSGTSTKTAPGKQSSTSAPIDFPSFGQKSGEPAAPSFAEMNLNAIKSPEFSETITDLDQFKVADTNPGFDLGSTRAAAPAPPPAAPPMPDLDLPQMAEGESTLILNKSQLAQDPDLFLQSTQFGKARTKSEPAPAPQSVPERFKEFKADETISISFGGETAPAPEKSAETAKPKDNFERERDMGLQAFKDANWDKAVYHLSIAAALRPEATDIKEQLRRARRMRKEREGGGAG